MLSCSLLLDVVLGLGRLEGGATLVRAVIRLQSLALDLLRRKLTCGQPLLDNLLLCLDLVLSDLLVHHFLKEFVWVLEGDVVVDLALPRLDDVARLGVDSVRERVLVHVDLARLHLRVQVRLVVP